jgi:predicted nucleic acid-binding protein
MAFVLDASVTITWAMRDEHHPLADLAAIRLQTESAVVPTIWWYEVQNMLVVNERRQRILPAASAQFLLGLNLLPIKMLPIAWDSNAPELARNYGLTVYDASYLELALRESLPLATLDKALRTAAEAAGVPLLA